MFDPVGGENPTALDWLGTLNSYALQWYNIIAGKPQQQQRQPSDNLPHGSMTTRSWFEQNWQSLAIFALLGVGVALGIRAAMKR